MLKPNPNRPLTNQELLMRSLLVGLVAVACLAFSPAAAQPTAAPPHGTSTQAHGANPQGSVGQVIEGMRAGGLVLDEGQRLAARHAADSPPIVWNERA